MKWWAPYICERSQIESVYVVTDTGRLVLVSDAEIQFAGYANENGFLKVIGKFDWWSNRDQNFKSIMLFGKSSVELINFAMTSTSNGDFSAISIPGESSLLWKVNDQIDEEPAPEGYVNCFVRGSFSFFF